MRWRDHLQRVSPQIARACAPVALGVDLAVLIDSTEQARTLAEAAGAGGAMPAMLIEIDAVAVRGAPRDLVG